MPEQRRRTETEGVNSRDRMDLIRHPQDSNVRPVMNAPRHDSRQEALEREDVWQHQYEEAAFLQSVGNDGGKGVGDEEHAPAR
jgi:hypothetical protein